MQPEFLFRGKRLDNGEWVYGFYAERVSDIFPKRKTCYILDQAKDKYGFPVGELRHHAVDPTTVGLYTGLTDKNGVRIFEGDVVRYVYEPGQGFWNANQTCLISWKETGFYMEGIMGTNKYACLSGWLTAIPYSDSGENFEVIGNIHDNLELLEVRDEAD